MKNNNKFRLDAWGGITLLMLGFYGLFLLFPLANLTAMAFTSTETGRFSFEHFIRFFSKPYYSSTLSNSFKVSIAATATSLLAGVPLAYFLTVYKIK